LWYIFEYEKENLSEEVISGIVFELDQPVIKLEVKNFNPLNELISFKTFFFHYKAFDIMFKR